MSIYDFNVTGINGQDISMANYKGKVLLIVNVASKCAFTSQYAGLEKLYEEFKEEGFMILGFPSNQFSEQEPANNKEIQLFCQSTYGVSFDMFAKIDVNGEKSDPLYKYLKKAQGGFLTDSIKWNFTKFLVDREGNVIDRFSPSTKPSAIKKSIKKLLKKD